MKRVILVIFCAFFSQLAAASYYAQNGISSIMLRNADLLARGQRMVDLSVFMDSYRLPSSSADDQDGYIQPGFAYGYNDKLSLALAAPMVAISNSKLGLREVNAIAKYSLGGGRDDGVSVALSGYTGLMSAKSSEGFGSGERGYGLAMNISLYGDVTTLNLSLGGEKSDIKVPGASPTFRSEQQFMLAGGIEYQQREKWKYLLEGIYTRTNDIDDNFLLMPGARYQLDQRMSFYAGAAFGIPKDKSIPEWRLTAGVNFNLDAGD